MNKKILYFLPIFLLIIGSAIFINNSYSAGFLKGYQDALTDVSTLTDIEFTWTLNNGQYTLSAYKDNQLMQSMNVALDVYIEHRDAQGNLISYQRNAGVLTNIGKDQIEKQISGTASATEISKFISCDDTDASGLSVASTQLTSELNANGFTRATGVYASTGVGAWNVTYTFTSAGTQAVQTYGLQWVVTAVSDNNLLCYDTSAVKNTVTGDTLKVTWQCTVT
jgi:hypothetical protein